MKGNEGGVRKWDAMHLEKCRERRKYYQEAYTRRLLVYYKGWERGKNSTAYIQTERKKRVIWVIRV